MDRPRRTALLLASSLVALLGLAACATSPAPGAAAGGTTTAAERRICRDEQPTGQRITKRTCMTPEEDAAARARAEAVYRNSVIRQGDGGT